jgi:hypothetical protein
MEYEQLLRQDITYLFYFLLGKNGYPFFQRFPFSKFFEKLKLFQLIELFPLLIPIL